MHDFANERLPVRLPQIQGDHRWEERKTSDCKRASSVTSSSFRDPSLPSPLRRGEGDTEHLKFHVLNFYF
jgi:hypothetical protein